ncbi:MAG: GNAT family N-acetyltransferase [Vicinamibacterales bacterium]
MSVSLAVTDAERQACFGLRYRIYIEEQGRRPAAADHERRLDCNADDEGAILLQARMAGELVGTARVHHGRDTGIPAFLQEACELTRRPDAPPLEHVAAISRLAIDPAHRGSLVVVALFRACFEVLHAEGRDTRLVIIVALDQPGLPQMYQALGFRPVAPGRTCMTDLGPATPMIATMRPRSPVRGDSP